MTSQKPDKKKRYPSALNISKAKADLQSQNILNKTENFTNNQKDNQQLAKFEGLEINGLEKLSKISAKHREILRDTFEEIHRNKK